MFFKRALEKVTLNQICWSWESKSGLQKQNLKISPNIVDHVNLHSLLLFRGKHNVLVSARAWLSHARHNSSLVWIMWTYLLSEIRSLPFNDPDLIILVALHFCCSGKNNKMNFKIKYLCLPLLAEENVVFYVL